MLVSQSKIQEMRQKMIEIVEKVGKGHLGTSLSSLEAILAIRERMKENDIFISSKGHDALAQYMVLAEYGILDDCDVETFRQSGGLPSHPTVDIPGIAANTGSLGMGLSKALGFALGQDRHVYVLLGDGEMMEGQNYEAMLAATKNKATNITAIVDCNGFGQDGPAPLTATDITKLFQAAGWRAYQMGPQHDYIDLLEAIEWEKGIVQFPVAIVLNTTKGKGASFEGTWQSHAGPPREDYSVQHPSYRKFGQVVERVMKDYPQTILCGADTLRDLNCYHLKEKYPNRVFDFGIAEQNIISFASARALMGEIPIVATYASFLRRGFEQIYNQVTEGTQVLYIGTMAGPLEEGGPGISHQSLWLLDQLNKWMSVSKLTPSSNYFIQAWFDHALRIGETTYLELLHHDPGTV